MIKDSVGISGGELLKNPMGMIPSSRKDILIMPKHGGGLGRSGNRVQPAAEPEEDLVPVREEKENRPEVMLSKPRWSEGEGRFEGKISALVDVELPASLANLTRISFILFRLAANGKKEQVGSQDAHADGGKAETEFTLPRPPDVDGKPVETCEYVFTAKHRDSEEAASPKLPAKASPLKLVLELNPDSEIKKPGYSLVLKSADGAVHASLKAADGKDADGVLSFEFSGLDANVSYVLELLDDKGQVAEEIFVDKKHGDWEGDGA